MYFFIGGDIYMRLAYNSSDYWRTLIVKSKTLRGQMFMDEQITEKTVYVHGLIFCRNSGIENLWAPIPSSKFLIGYIQYSFLQEAFYKWSFLGRRNGETSSTAILSKPTEEIINLAVKEKKISKEEEKNMKRHIEMIKRCWGLSADEIMRELKKFARDFNKTWVGNNTEFLYLKVFSNAEELADFVIETANMTSLGENFQKELGVDEEGLRKICMNAHKDKASEKMLKDILSKKLTEIL